MSRRRIHIRGFKMNDKDWDKIWMVVLLFNSLLLFLFFGQAGWFGIGLQGIKLIEGLS